jgi:hypothetical protein
VKHLITCSVRSIRFMELVVLEHLVAIMTPKSISHEFHSWPELRLYQLTGVVVFRMLDTPSEIISR